MSQILVLIIGINIFFNIKRSATEAHRMLSETYGETA